MTHRSSLHTSPSHRRQRYRQRTTWRTVKDYLVGAVFFGGVAGLGLHLWDEHQARKAILEALPAGYVFPGCDEVRARGLAPLHQGESGFGSHLDGDGDGIGCEPYP